LRILDAAPGCYSTRLEKSLPRITELTYRPTCSVTLDGGESPEVIWHQEDIVSFLTRRPNTFDNVFALDFSEHVDDDVWAGILAGVTIALKPEGSLYIHTPNREYIIEVLKHVGILKQFPEHIAVRDAVQNSRLLQDAGFQLVSCKFLSHYEPRQKPLALLSYVPFLGRFFRARLFITARKGADMRALPNL